MKKSASKSYDVEGSRINEVKEEHEWDLPDVQIVTKRWRSLLAGEKVKRVLVDYVGKTLGVMSCLYFFICSLDLMSSAFRLLGAKTAGKVFSESQLLNNPITALMVGVLVAALLHSSAIVSSVLIAMVASGIIKVRTAIPIIMGADIGTAITNIIVSLGQSGDREQFKRAFAAATVHDMFNWLSVVVFLPLELMTGFLYHITNFIVNKLKIEKVNYQQNHLIKKLTKPFTGLIIKLDDDVLKLIAKNDPQTSNLTILERYCMPDGSDLSAINLTTMIPNSLAGAVRCKSLFSQTNWSDKLIGSVLLVVSLCLLCCCLISMVKILQSVLKTRVSLTIRKIINYKFPGKFAFLTGYFAIFFGAFVTFMIQSSTIFTSTLTPLVGLGLVAIENVYPMTLGSNIGTTTTGLMASLAVGTDRLKDSLHIALVHTFYNVFGVLLWYVIPFMRWPLFIAKFLGDVTSRYRWFSIAYLLFFYLVVPTLIFSLSAIGGLKLLLSVVIPLLILLTCVICINLLQKRKPKMLPPVLRSWDFLPVYLRSLDPIDTQLTRLCHFFQRFSKCWHRKEKSSHSNQDVELTKEPDTKNINGSDFVNQSPKWHKNMNGTTSTTKLIRDDESYLQLEAKRISNLSRNFDDSGIVMMPECNEDGGDCDTPPPILFNTGINEYPNNPDSDSSEYSNKNDLRTITTLTKVGPQNYVKVSQ